MPTPGNPTFTTPRTLLEAVNELMAAVKLAYLSSLADATTNPNATDAFRAIATACRDIQVEKWHFNTDEDMVFTPNVGGEIFLPPNVLRFVLSPRCRYLDCVVRGSRLYNRKEHTYVFTDVVRADVAWILDFEECPEPVRWLITAQAGLGFVTQKAPGTQNFRFTSSGLEKARTEAEGWDRESRGETLAASSPHINKMRRR